MAQSFTNSGVVMICNPDPDGWRRRIIEKYVFDKFPDSKVYGTWEQGMRDVRFKPPIPHENFGQMLSGFRYTLCIPVVPGFATAKYVEMLHHNIIPFFHESYDSQKNVNIPEFLRVSSPNDFEGKVHALNQDEKYGYKVIN